MNPLLKRFSYFTTMTTIRDLARKLDLSIGAVSRALDGYPDISEETRQRVIQAAQEMGYAPNRAARQLRRRRADAIGYILPAGAPRFADPFFSEFIAGLGDETALHPFDLLISIAPPGEAAEQQIYQNWVQARKVDGFVLNRLRLTDWRVRFLAEHNVPLVGLEHTLDGIDYPRIEIDSLGGIAQLVTHLSERGFRRIAYVGGPEHLKIQADRLAAYRQSLDVAGLQLDPELVAAGDLTNLGGYAAAKALLTAPRPPDALVCINDETACGVIHAAHERGLTVGQNLAVAGFDGVQASAYTEPPLTTLDTLVYDIARQLVRLLVGEITHQPLPERCSVIQPRLLVRQSTGGA
jgi:DNA-binding LacI/PurR family transcriptional regulator